MMDNELLQAISDMMDTKLEPIQTEIKTIKEDLQTVKQKVTRLEISIETELIPNIQRVAEGHVDLFRNLSDVKSTLEVMNGKLEMNDIYIRHHDAEIKKLQVIK